MGWRWVDEHVGPKLRPRLGTLSSPARRLLKPYITAGYRAMAKKCHPDMKGGSNKKMKSLTELRKWLEGL